MGNVNITIRIDKDLKNEVEELFGDFGLSLSAAVNMFFRQAIRDQAVPFEIKRKKSTVEYLPDNLVKKIAKEKIEENLEAYKELAKK